jgi:hypothetical protein
LTAPHRDITQDSNVALEPWDILIGSMDALKHDLVERLAFQVCHDFVKQLDVPHPSVESQGR